TSSYNNLGNVYKDKGEYGKALEYHQKSLNIRLKAFGKEHSYVAKNYSNIGDVFKNKGEFTKAKAYQNKALAIYINTFGRYHPDIGRVYNSLAAIYVAKTSMEHGSPRPKLRAPYLLDTALFYYQQAIQSLVKGFPDNGIYVNPVLKKVFIPGKVPKIEGVQSMLVLLAVLEGKAEAFYRRWKEGKK
ncbi:MAG: tetratricopeptide repeat protein, partial [Cytophagales bacterium]|nr:tetratricopeptide repeat protein [Cytophagales bacterium]